MMPKRPATLCAITIFAALVLSLHGANACRAASQIPVFRYALERWEPDLYEAIIFHRGSLGDEHQVLLEQLDRLASGSGFAGDGSANMRVLLVDLDGEVSEPMLKLWSQQSDQTAPKMLVRYPGTLGFNAVAWSGALNPGNVNGLIDSPARRKIAERLLAGDAAVFVLIESGTAGPDQAATAALEQTLPGLKEALKLPAKDVIESDEHYLPDTKVPLKLGFSFVRLSRSDEAERIFIAMLTGIEADLAQYRDQPVVIPVFGRGRTLWGIVGKEIDKASIANACGELVAPAATTMKSLTTGVDLLMAVDWNARVFGEEAATTRQQPTPANGEIATAPRHGDANTTAQATDVQANTPEAGHTDTASGTAGGVDHSDADTAEAPARPQPAAGAKRPPAPFLGENFSAKLPIALVVLLGVAVLIIGVVMLRARHHLHE